MPISYDLECVNCHSVTSANDVSLQSVQRLGCSECGGWLKITTP